MCVNIKPDKKWINKIDGGAEVATGPGLRFQTVQILANLNLKVSVQPSMPGILFSMY